MSPATAHGESSAALNGNLNDQQTINPPEMTLTQVKDILDYYITPMQLHQESVFDRKEDFNNQMLDLQKAYRKLHKHLPRLPSEVLEPARNLARGQNAQYWPDWMVSYVEPYLSESRTFTAAARQGLAQVDTALASLEPLHRPSAEWNKILLKKEKLLDSVQRAEAEAEETSAAFGRRAKE